MNKLVNKEKVRKYNKTYREKNKKKLRKINKELYHNNLDTYRGYNTSKKLKSVNLTIEEYNKIKEIQNNLCEICGNPERRLRKDGSIQNLSIDHDHNTGKFRGLLCQDCNIALGLLQDNIESLEKAIEYLKKHNKVEKEEKDEYNNFPQEQEGII